MAGMTKPTRIQRRRTRGWRMPENAVYVGRPTKWGNPFWVTSDHPIEIKASVEWYSRWLAGEDGLGAGTNGAGGLAIAQAAVAELRGKDLCCWCPLDGPCHADVLLEVANS